MNLRKMLVLLAAGFVAVVALGVYVLVVDRGTPPSDEAGPKRVLPFGEMSNARFHEGVARLEITHGKDAPIAIEKADAQGWRLRKPLDGPADAATVLAILGALRELQFDQAVQPAPGETAGYGFGAPRFQVRLWVGGKCCAFEIGGEARGRTPSEKKAYLRLEGDPRVFVVDDRIAGVLARRPLSLLDRQIFAFLERDVVRLTIERLSAKLVCERVRGAWKLTSATPRDADPANVAIILGAMDDLKAEEFVAAAPADLKPFGLDAPDLRLTAAIEPGQGPASWRAGGEPPRSECLLLSRTMDGKTYGMKAGGTLVFTVKSWDAASLRTEPVRETGAK